MAKGMVDSFLILLGVALFILLIISLISGSFLTGTGQKELKVIEEFSLGTIGIAQDFPTRTILLGDSRVGETQTDLLKEVIQVDVNQGLIGGRTETFTVFVDQAFLDLRRGGKITFYVGDSNPLGPLVIKWNGKEIFRGTPQGRQEVSIGADYMKDENRVEIYTEGPGIVFWSSSMYRLDHFITWIEYGPQKIVPFDLLPVELQAFERGEVEFYGSGPGRLDIKVNRVTIFSDIPLGPEKVPFTLTTAPVHAGNNVLSFVSTGSNGVSGGILRIFSIAPQTSKIRYFSLAKEDLDKVGRGRIDFKVDNILRPGVLTIKLNGNEIDVQAVAEGENTVSYSKEFLKEGENTIEFSGSGGWEIPSVKVGYEV